MMKNAGDGLSGGGFIENGVISEGNKVLFGTKQVPVEGVDIFVQSRFQAFRKQKV